MKRNIHAMITPILTRYLYMLDETMYSLLYALITKTSLDECVFWLGEMYYSGYRRELWRFIWCVYYDFFAVRYPKYEKKMTTLYMKWQKQDDIMVLLTSIHLLYYSSVDATVFTLRMLNANLPNKVYMGRLPKWLKALHMAKRERHLIRSIHERNMVNIAYHLRYFETTPEVAYAAIKTYFRKIHGYVLKDMELTELPYKNTKHILMAVICYLLQDEKDIQKRLICIKLDEEKYTKAYDASNQPIQPLYQTLFKQRKYPVSNKIGCFALSRFHLPHKDQPPLDHKQVLWHHWEYFAYRAPIWKKRFDQYKILVNHNSYCIVFKDVDEEEAFYETYYYEADEQSKPVQDYSILDIPKIDWLTWMEETFQKKVDEKLKRSIKKETYYYISWEKKKAVETGTKNKVESI